MSGESRARAATARGGWIGRMHWLVTLALVIAVLTAVGGLVQNVAMAVPGGPRAGAGFGGLWPTRADVSLADALAPGVHTVQVSIEASLYDPSRAPLLGALHLLTWLPGMLIVLFVLFRLFRITLRGQGGDRQLFSAATVADLRKIGTVLIAGTLTALALDFAAKTVAARMLIVDPYAVVPGDVLNPIPGLLVGLAAFVVTEVIGRGLALVDDLEGTI